MTTDVERKLRDEHLRSLVEAGSETPVSVLVEVEWPAPKASGGGSDPRRRARVTAPDPDAEVQAQRQAQTVGAWLEDLLEEPPVWLRSAHAFAIRATGPQLARIAGWTMTRAIEPNRKLP